MKIKSCPMGAYMTNCYIVSINGKDVIIDPGVDAINWISKNVTNPIAILNTHGHFDHIWSNQAVKKRYNIPIYISKDDAFMLDSDPFNQGVPKSQADILVDNDEIFNIDGIEFEYINFKGHSPGCCVIRFDDTIFCGDFIFKGSIGRVDLPYSSPQNMKKSLEKVLKMKKDYKLYCGHGDSTTLNLERSNLKNWIKYI